MVMHETLSPIRLPPRLIGLKPNSIVADATLRLERWQRLRDDAFGFSKAAVTALDRLEAAGGAPDPTARCE